MNRKYKALVKDLIIVGAGILAILIGLQLFFGTSNPFYVVASGSMVPELQVYDIIVIYGNEPFEEVEVGDIIVFDRPSDHDRVIVHRIVSITDRDPFTVRTQGDANPASIPGTDFPITEEEYIGTVAYVIPQVGFITKIFATQVGGIPLNYIIVAIIIGIMVVRYMTKKPRTTQTRPYGSRTGHDPGMQDAQPQDSARTDNAGHEKQAGGKSSRPGSGGGGADRRSGADRQRMDEFKK